MPKVTYHIVEHDWGWAYKVGDVFSETFPSHDEARAAAERAAAEQQVSGETTEISNTRTRKGAGGSRRRRAETGRTPTSRRAEAGSPGFARARVSRRREKEAAFRRPSSLGRKRPRRAMCGQSRRTRHKVMLRRVKSKNFCFVGCSESCGNLTHPEIRRRATLAVESVMT